MPGGQKITVPYSTQGVSGVDIFKLGAGTTDELLPIPGTKSSAYHRPVSYPGGQKDVSIMNSSYLHTFANGDRGIKFFKIVAIYADSDLIHIRPISSGFTDSVYFHKNYYVRGPISDATTTQESTYNYYTLHTTKADSVSGANPVSFGTMSGGTPSHCAMKVDEMVSVRNALFDYNNDLPVFGIWPGNVYNNPDITTASSNVSGLADNGNWRYRLCQWNFMSGVLMENQGWRQALGCSMLQNDPPYRDAGAGVSAQARIMSMYGLGTINPGGFSTDLNLPTMHTTDGSIIEATSFVGNTNAWTSQHWSQFMEMPELSLGDKIKISAKVRCPADNALREKNFGGLYFSWRYPISDTQTKHRIDYIAIKGSAVTGSQAPFTGDVGTSLGEKRSNFRVGMQGGSGYNFDIEDITTNYKTITERDSYNAEDLGSWTEISVEIPVPSDISLSDITYSVIGDFGNNPNDGAQAYGTREGGLTNQIASNLRCGIGMFFAENGSYMTNTAGGILTQGHEFVPGAVYFIHDNKSGLRADALTQAELHETAGTTPAAVQPSNVMKVGGTYTIETLGTMDASSDWTKVFVQNADFSTGLSVSNYIATHGGSGYDGVGFAFTVAQISGDLTGTATVRQSGYPEGFALFRPTKNNPATHARGQFKRSSGLIEFYSPKIEYIPVA